MGIKKLMAIAIAIGTENIYFNPFFFGRKFKALYDYIFIFIRFKRCLHSKIVAVKYCG